MNETSNQPPLRTLVYTSSSEHGWSDAELTGLIRQAEFRNLSLGVTGRLVYINGRFIQVLEGPGQTAMDLYRRISRDPRHSEVMLVYEASVLERAYVGWSMDLVHGRNVPKAQSVKLLARVAAGQNQPAGYWQAVLKGIRDLETSMPNGGVSVAPQQGRAYATVERLLDAARKLMLRDGPSAAAIPAVAALANVSVNTAYRYFSSTDQIISALVRRWQTARLAAFTVRLAELRFASMDDLAREIADHVALNYLANDLLPLQVRQAGLRNYHRIAYDELWEIAGMVVETIRRDGLADCDPAQRARVAMAFAGIAAQAKMAALHAQDQLRTEEFRAAMVLSLLDAVHGAALTHRGAAKLERPPC